MLTSAIRMCTWHGARITSLVHRVRGALPEGRPLPDRLRGRRHRGTLIVLWLHAFGIAGFGMLAEQGRAHNSLEAAIVAGIALVAVWEKFGCTFRTVVASCGLITASTCGGGPAGHHPDTWLNPGADSSLKAHCAASCQ